MASGREPTLADVAACAGVSLTTVSRVLNNRGYLSQATKDKVHAAIAKLGYRPNALARGLQGKSARLIGVMVPTVAQPFFGELAARIEDALAPHGYRILVCNSLNNAQREKEYVDLLVSQRVDGIISSAHNEHIDTLKNLRLPLVSVDRRFSPTIPDVASDNVHGGRLATAALLRHGATRPALLTSRSGARNAREKGYRAILHDHGIEPVVISIDFHTSPQRRPELIAEALSAHPEIDSVFATDDLSAAEVMAWAGRQGRLVGEDFRIVGFDGTETMRRVLPGLATIRQDLAQIAEIAVEMVLARIEGNQWLGTSSTPEESGDAIRRIVPVELIEAHSLTGRWD